MKVVALLHFASPWRNAGSETMLHTMCKALVQRGHEVTVTATSLPEAPPTWNHEGVQGVNCSGVAEAVTRGAAMRPDLVLTHHDSATAGIQMARRIGAKSVFVQHNTFALNNQVLATGPDVTIFNTEWTAREWAHKANRWMVVHPPVWAHEHATTPGESITLINLNRDKGVEIWSRLAQHFKNRHFLGVTGGHGNQITWGHPDNCEIIPHSRFMREEVWSRTKILLVPSVYESYGMVAAEACASGIPVIATPTPGLQESLSWAGSFAQRGNVAQWVAQLRKLLEVPGEWEAASERSRQRSIELNPEPELAQFVQAMEELAGVHAVPA